MPVTRYTADDFAKQISDNVRSRDKTIDTRIGSYSDFFIDPFSEVLQTQNERIYYTNQLPSLKNADTLIPDDVDDIIYNENMVRFQQTPSTTVLVFSRLLPPTTDIPIPISFPVSTPINQVTGNSVIFRTIESATMKAATASQYYNTETGKYEISVPIVSISKGTNAQVGAYTITEMRRSLSDFDEIYNPYATTSGKGVETNAEVAKRFSLHITGSDISTPDGLKKYIMDNFSNVKDAYTVYGNNPYLTRTSTDPGGVDAWVLGSVPITRTYTTSYQGTYTLNSVDFQPLDTIIKVSSVSAGATYIEGTDYEVAKGEGIYAYSNRGQDGIRWIPGGSHPALGQSFTIEYSYNSLMNQLTSFFKTPDKYHNTSDNLFRWSQPVQIEINATLKVKSGSPQNVIASVKQAILTYINGLLLGETVEEFDLDGVVSKIYGVDNFTWSLLAVKGGSGVSDIEIGPNGYARIEEADLVINPI